MDYPNFTQISAQHKDVIDSITCRFPPYCDVQFSNLLSWSSDKIPTMFSILDGNLVVRMKEYDSDNLITMFVGNQNVLKSLNIILEDYPVVERVPEEVVKEIVQQQTNTNFKIIEDHTNNDYVLDLNKVTSLSGNKLKSKRRNVSAFQRLYPEHKVIEMSPDYIISYPAIEDFFKEVAKEKGDTPSALADELDAIGKLLKNQKLFNLPMLGVTHSSRLIGFTINEILNGNPHFTALGCFGKGLRKFTGIYAYLEFITAKHLLQRGCKYINIEEDLGYTGLNESKRLWRPAKLLKKYVIIKNC